MFLIIISLNHLLEIRSVLKFFKDLLRQEGIEPEQRFLDLIAGSGWFSNQLIVAETPQQAANLYNAAARIPQSQTRAEVFRDENVKIGALMPVDGAQTTSFFLAFEKDIPKVLKVPADVGKVGCECLIYFRHGEEAKESGVALVPVREINLRGERTSYVSPRKVLSKGILMPSYVCSLANVPPPLSAKYVLTKVKDFLLRLHLCMKSTGFMVMLNLEISLSVMMVMLG